MIVYQTNLGLGYNQYAYYIDISSSLSGFEFLCVGITYRIDSDIYKVGEPFNNDSVNPMMKQISDFDIRNSPLHDTFLFNEFITLI